MIATRVEGMQEEMEWPKPAMQPETNMHLSAGVDGGKIYHQPPERNNLKTKEIESARKYRVVYGISVGNYLGR